MCNTCEPRQYYFQNGGSEMQLDILYLNDYIQYWLLLMIIIITWIYIFILYNYLSNTFYKYYSCCLIDLNHGTFVEIIWTLIPAIILIFIAIPGFTTLYQLDYIINSHITVKCIGSQWYWSYQINDHSFDSLINVNFDSYMVPTDSLNIGDLRLLQVDNSLILPVNKPIRLIVTSSDVIHSFSLPSLGIKIDAVPGRLNQCSVIINRYGSFYGSCQEICGIQHAFMPIKIISTTYHDFFNWAFNLSF